jgi:hypothetical protein
MNLPSEFFATPLSAVEFKTAVSLYHLASPEGRVEATTDELSILTGYSSESLRRALRGLEKAGILATTRTKRNLGKWSRNIYQLVLPSHNPVDSEPEPSHKPVGWSESPSHKAVGSTGGQVVPVGTGKLTTSSQVSREVNTTYLHAHTEGVSEMKEVVLSSEKWRPRGEDTSGDDDLGGFGLLDEPQKVSGKPVNKRDAKTRGRRPEHEWSAYDVAAEFSYRMGRKFPYTPGLINIQALTGALRKYRNQYGITAPVELELMRMFFADAHNLYNIEKDPAKVHGRYLNMFKSHLQKAYKNLGMDTDPVGDTPEEGISYVDETLPLYASDGQEFENTLAGRAALARYEQKLIERNKSV